MTTTKILASVTMAAALVLATSACSSDADPQETQTPTTAAEADTPTPAAPPEKEDEGTDKSIDYTDPSQAQDYCGVFKDMEKLSEEAESQNMEASTKQTQERMDILARTAGKLSELAETDEEKKQWAAMEDDSQKAVDFLKSSGGDVRNDDFIVLLGKAYDSSSKAYEAQADKVKDECGVDLKKFMIAEEDQG